MSSSRNTLSKAEILRKGRILDSLFLPKESISLQNVISRHSLYATPIKCRVMFRNENSGNEPLQAMFSVPKRFFKRAVKRNKFRRRMKEAYRISKNELKEMAIQHNISVSVHLTYSTDKELEYNEIKNAIQTIIKEISDKLTSCIN